MWIYHDRSLYKITGQTDKQYITERRILGYEARFWKDVNGEIRLVGKNSYKQSSTKLLSDQQAQIMIRNTNLKQYRDAIIKELCDRLTDGRINLTPSAAQELNLEHNLGIYPRLFDLPVSFNRAGQPIVEDTLYNTIDLKKS